MNDNTIILNTAVLVGDRVRTGLSRKYATVLEFVDQRTMRVRWEDDGTVSEVLRVAFVKA